ncbi:hypothetical protein SAMN05216359_1272 [Roseateles sp. YR242]|nr:hypothetical protein SAMN05216359_1272 [Roseateles sp. YR242]
MAYLLPIGVSGPNVPKPFEWVEALQPLVEGMNESPRILRRLNTLRGLSHEQVEQVLTRGA